jgi:VWFA-related protein
MARRSSGWRTAAFVWSVVLGWLLPGDLRAQDQPVHSFPTRTDIITVDVVVLDRAGRPMRGLQQSDFTVLEDGRRQEIVAFEARDLRAPPPAATAANPAGLAAAREAREPTPGRTLGFVVDDLSGFQCVTSVKAIRSWIEEKADPRDQVSLFTTSSRVQPVEARIATGRAALLRALDAVRCLTLPGADAGYGGGGSIVGPNADPNAIASSMRAQEAYAAWRTRARAVVSSIEGFSRGHASERGRKPVFVFTEGFPRDADLKQAEQAIDVAHRTNTALYFINPRGLGSAMNEGGVGFAGAAHMAAETGGALVSNNDVAGSLVRAIDQTEAYYLLGYVPAKPPDGKWRKLQVKVARPGVEVRARRGYVASVEPAEIRTRTAVALRSATEPPARGEGSQRLLPSARPTRGYRSPWKRSVSLVRPPLTRLMAR